MIAVVLTLLAGTARAAPPAPPPSVASAAASATPQEKTEQTAAALVEMAAGLEAIDELLKEAEGSDTVDVGQTLQCLNNRRSSLQALQTMTQSASASLAEALANGDTATANFEFRKVLIARNKTRSLVSEARRCGTGSDQSGTAQTDLDVDDGGIGQDETLTTTTPTTGTSTPTDITIFQ